MEERFTKGEWKSEGKTLYSLHETGRVLKGEPEMSNRFYAGFYPDYVNGVTDEEAEANCLLAASAPELYEACKELIALLNFHGYRYATEITKAENAIKKALGKEV